MSTEAPPELPPAAIYQGNDKIWVLLCHLSPFLGAAFLLPFVVYLAMKNDSPTVTYHAKESLNFHISCFLYALICAPFCFILVGIPMLMVVGLFSVIFAVIAAMKASDGIPYRYPFTIRFF